MPYRRVTWASLISEGISGGRFVNTSSRIRRISNPRGEIRSLVECGVPVIESPDASDGELRRGFSAKVDCIETSNPSETAIIVFTRPGTLNYRSQSGKWVKFFTNSENRRSTAGRRLSGSERTECFMPSKSKRTAIGKRKDRSRRRHSRNRRCNWENRFNWFLATLGRTAMRNCDVYLLGILTTPPQSTGATRLCWAMTTPRKSWARSLAGIMCRLRYASSQRPAMKCSTARS